MVKALIACHAGSGVGLGHFSRSMVVARMLKNRFSAEVHWLIQGDPFARLDLSEFKHAFVPPDGDLLEVLIRQSPVDIAIFDLHPAYAQPTFAKALRSLRDKGAKVVAIDGLTQFRTEVDLSFIPAIDSNLPLDDIATSPIVFGWDCLLLDESLKPSPWSPGKRVLALTGGSDATGLGDLWPTLMNRRLPLGTTLEWVTGPFAPPPHLPPSPRINIIEQVAPAGLGDIMQRANYAVTVFGVTLFELLFLGIPTVVFSPYGSRDVKELLALKAAGLVVVARDQDEAVNELNRLMQDNKLAVSLSDKARSKIPVSGSERLYREISSMLQC